MLTWDATRPGGLRSGTQRVMQHTLSPDKRSHTAGDTPPTEARVRSEGPATNKHQETPAITQTKQASHKSAQQHAPLQDQANKQSATLHVCYVKVSLLPLLLPDMKRCIDSRPATVARPNDPAATWVSAALLMTSSSAAPPAASGGTVLVRPHRTSSVTSGGVASGAPTLNRVLQSSLHIITSMPPTICCMPSTQGVESDVDNRLQKDKSTKAH